MTSDDLKTQFLGQLFFLYILRLRILRMAFFKVLNIGPLWNVCFPHLPRHCLEGRGGVHRTWWRFGEELGRIKSFALPLLQYPKQRILLALMPECNFLWPHQSKCDTPSKMLFYDLISKRGWGPGGVKTLDSWLKSPKPYILEFCQLLSCIFYPCIFLRH